MVIFLGLTFFNVPYILWIMLQRGYRDISPLSVPSSFITVLLTQAEAFTEEMFEALRREFLLGTLA